MVFAFIFLFWQSQNTSHIANKNDNTSYTRFANINPEFFDLKSLSKASFWDA